MKIQEIQLSEIKPYKKNVKKHDDRQIEAVAESIRTFGAKQPIVVDKNYVIIIGHCRYEAAKLLGMETFPTIVADLTQKQADALRIADNKTNESEWDYDTLYDELRELESAIDLSLYGFTVADFIAAHSDEYEPETLDFDGIEDYEENGNNMLKSKQVTISYNTQEERTWLTNMLGVEKLKVTIYASEL